MSSLRLTLALPLLLGGLVAGCSSTDASRASARGQASAVPLSVARLVPARVTPERDSQRFALGASVMFQTDGATPDYSSVIFTFRGVCAPAIEVDVIFDAKGFVAETVRAYDGDWSSDSFLLQPYLDEVRQALTQHCAELEDISFKLTDGSDRSTTQPFEHLHLAAADDWSVEREQFVVDPAYQAGAHQSARSQQGALAGADPMGPLPAAVVAERQAAEERREALAQERAQREAQEAQRAQREAELARQEAEAARAAQAALAARGAQLEQNSPFAGYPAGAYFAALLERDYEYAAHIDREYTQVYQDQMAGEAGEAFGLMSILLGGGDPDDFEETTEAVREATKLASLMETLLGHYLKSYSRVYPEACLGDDALTVRIVISEQLVDESGFPLGPASETPIDFPVKRVFYDILSDMATRSAALSADLDALFQSRGTAITQADTLLGIDRIREDFACDSPEVLALEQSFREYWAIVLARMKPVGMGVNGGR